MTNETYTTAEDFKNKITMQKTAENLQAFTKAIETHFDKYETRDSQKSMIRTIVKGMAMGEHSMIEAPTGTGKSLAYLLAFLSVWNQFEERKSNDGEIIERKPKLCVATNTIALQEQLMAKDIPMLQEVLGLDFKAALIKGRNNYVCPRELYPLQNDDSKGFSTVEESVEFGKLIKEVLDQKGKLKPEKGDRSEISFTISNGLWSKMSTDSKNCTGVKCPFHSECPFVKAKAENAKADILVTNHSMFFADLKVQMDTEFEVEGLVLPSYDYLTFDEAHNLEEVASQFFGARLSLRGLKNSLGSFKKKTETGGELNELFLKLPQLKNEIEVEFNQLITLGSDFYTYIFRQVSQDLSKGVTVRLFQQNEEWNNFSTYFMKQFYNLIEVFKEAKNVDIDDMEDKERDSLSRFITFLHESVNELKDFLFQKVEDSVYWVETSAKRFETQKEEELISLNHAPINVGPTLAESLFERQESVVLTSATLGTDNLDYMASRLGLHRYIGKMFFSPFDYQKQSAIYIPAQTVNPKSKDYGDYAEFEMRKIIKEAKGRTLVLFTSYSMLNQAHKNLKPYIEEELGYKLLKQGDLPRTPLINEFRENVNSVLFATSSYWEGIDVQGEALSSVIIVKLPFDVPDQPVIQARMEHITSRGGNPFMDYQVPIAIMKFKQGFGRLIRSTKDTGVVSILDERVIKMHYGKKFLNSLPQVNIYRDIEQAKSFFE